MVVGAVGLELPFVHGSAATLSLDFVFGGQVFSQELMYSGNPAVQGKIAFVAEFYRHHGCWHDGKVEFDHFDFFWCPRKTNINDKFECTKMISSKQVIRAIDSIIERSVNGTGNSESAGK